MSSYGQAETRSMDNNHRNVEDLFNEYINIAKTQNVSNNTTSSSKGIASYFELFL